MASKSGNLEADKAADVEGLLDALETLLDRIKVLYEQYFLGIQKQAPSYLHHDLERKLRDLSQLQIRNTALRYRFATVQQKFGAYNTYWRRTLRQIENGTYSRNLSRLSRQAARTGEAIPEEILAAMPKRMREQVARDRQVALAQQQRRVGHASAGGLELAPVEGDLELDLEEAALDDVATIHSPAPRVPVVHRLSEEDEVDVDALFAAITEGDEQPVPGRRTAPGVMPAARPTSEPMAARTTAPGVMPAARPVSEPASAATRTTARGLAPSPPGDEDAPTYRSAQPLPREDFPAEPTARSQRPSPAPRVGVDRGAAAAPGARASTDPGVGGGARPPHGRSPTGAPAPAGPSRPSSPPPIPVSAARRTPGSNPPQMAPGGPPPVRPGTAAPVEASAPPESGPGRSRVVPPSGVPPLHRPPPKSEPLPSLRARPTPSIPSIPSIPSPPGAGVPARSAPMRAPTSAEAAGGPARSAPMRAPTSSEAAGVPARSAPMRAPTSAEGAGGPARSAPMRAPTSAEGAGGPARSAPMRAPTSAEGAGVPARSAPMRAPTSSEGAPSRPVPRGVSEAEVARLYEQYVRARTSIGETSDARTYDRLVRTLEQQAPKIMEEHKAKGVEFQVVVKDNQVVLRAKPKP